MLLVVAESTGSSPGRQGYKMAIAVDGELSGSIGGGVMEVNLVDHGRAELQRHVSTSSIRYGSVGNQVHRANSPNASGMICSGQQTVIFTLLTPRRMSVIDVVIDALEKRRGVRLSLTAGKLNVLPPDGTHSDCYSFTRIREADFLYEERLGKKNDLYIIGGGHCSLALSELMSKMDFYIRILDDRPDLNTLDKNKFADEITIIDGYDRVGEIVSEGSNVYVVVMTLGYAFDEIVIRKLINKEFKYFGVLGSKAKMATLLKQLKNDGLPLESINRIRTPIGIPIRSHTPEEIAVSIAAEIISVKNS